MNESGTPNLSPTWAEMAQRMRSKARSLRYKATKYEGFESQALLDSAASFDSIADGLHEKHIESMYARDGLIAEYRKFRANQEGASV